MDNVVTNIPVQFRTKIPMNRIAGSYGKSMFDVLWNFPFVFQSHCIIQHPHQQRMRFPIILLLEIVIFGLGCFFVCFEAISMLLGGLLLALYLGITPGGLRDMRCWISLYVLDMYFPQ